MMKIMMTKMLIFDDVDGYDNDVGDDDYNKITQGITTIIIMTKHNRMK